jgi:hypothetical protein
MAMVTKRLVAGFLGACLVSQSLLGNAASSAFRTQGSELEYNLDRDEALQCFRQGVDADPGDSASYRAVAGTYFLAIAFRRGAVTMDDFLDEQVTTHTIDMPKPPAELRAGFQENAERALKLAEQQLRANPADPEAHYQVGQTIGLLASYMAPVDGEVFSTGIRGEHTHAGARSVAEGRGVDRRQLPIHCLDAIVASPMVRKDRRHRSEQAPRHPADP